MSDHDPLCGDCDPYDKYCHCALIARVRADEGKRIHETLVALENERDAARAEVAALRDELRAEDTERDMRLSAEAEVAALRVEVETLREQVRTGAW